VFRPDSSRWVAPRMNALIVQRGLNPLYYLFTEITVKANDMTLIIDRRVRERRLGIQQAEAERRANDRRAGPPVTWTRDGFMLVGSGSSV
jgi:hypothetical protein